VGRIKLDKMRPLGITAKDIVDHMLLRNEFVFRRCLPDQIKGQIMTVLDVKDVRLADISAEVITYIKLISEAMDLYYPGRVRRLVICNAPYW
jgi:hypothetical protein